MKYLLFLVIFLFSFGNSVCYASSPSKLICALIQVESSGNDYEIGDKKLKDKAYGCLQIREKCVADVNKAFGTSYRPEDCLGNRELSVWICEKYIGLYATEKRLGRNPTDKDRARIWNGGPDGWKKKSTKKYWEKVKKELAR